MQYSIHHSNGTRVAATRKLAYEGTMMGDVYVSCDIDSPSPIDWQIGDYIVFNGQRFVMTVLPTATRNARDNSRGDAVQYKSVRFQIEAISMMQDAMMLDYVTDDNNIHFTSLPNFSFYCSDDTIDVTEDGHAVQRCAGAWQLADRIKANLERAYPTKYWKVVVEEGVTVKPQSIMVSSQSVWNALADACDKLEINFTVTSALNDDDEPHPDDDPIDYTFVHTVTLGAIVHEIDNEFRYGKEHGISQGAGLMKIERNADENQQVITRLYAYGNTRNIPYRYYNNLPNVSESMYLPNLMLPMFRQNGRTAYVDSQNIATLGIKEGVKFFDGSDDKVPDIYPSIVGMTTQILYDSMTAEQREEQNIKDPTQFPSYDQGAVDEILSAEQVDFDGNIPEQQQTTKTFYVIIKNIGFDPNEQVISGETPKMAFNSGMLAGRECNIRTIEKITAQNAPTTYKVMLEVAQDTTINQYFPNTSYQVAAADKFVLLGIRMPDIYVTAAEQRLLTAATAFLADNDHTRYAYKLTIDNIYMARHPEIAQQLMPGTMINIVDASLSIDEHITISQMKITVGEASIPQYEVVLSDEIEPSTLQRVTNEATQQAVTITDTISTSNTNRIIARINALGDTFISKRGYDRAMGMVVFSRGIMAGEDSTAAISTAQLTQDQLVIKDYESETREIDTVTYDNVNDIGLLPQSDYTKYAEATVDLELQSSAVITMDMELYTEHATINSVRITAFDTLSPDTMILDYVLQNEPQQSQIQFIAEQGTRQYKVRATADITTNASDGEEPLIEIMLSGATMATDTQLQPRAMKMTPSGIYRLTEQGTWNKLL